MGDADTYELQDNLETAKEIAQSLTNIGARMVCVDFDATFLSIHTGGTWEFSAEELHVHVRPLFAVLVPLLANAGMRVALVTFSPQVRLIKDVLYLCFPEDVAQEIIVRGNDTSWSVSKNECIEFSSYHGDLHSDRSVKLPYIVSAALDASSLDGKRIRNIDTVLIDDDPHNIKLANDQGIAGIWFEPEEGDIKSLCKSIKKLQVAEPTGTPCKSTSRSHMTPASNEKFENGKRMKFNLCTPSPVMKIKCPSQLHARRPKKPSKSRCSRNIEDSLEDLHISAS